MSRYLQLSFRWDGDDGQPHLSSRLFSSHLLCGRLSVHDKGIGSLYFFVVASQTQSHTNTMFAILVNAG